MAAPKAGQVKLSQVNSSLLATSFISTRAPIQNSLWYKITESLADKSFYEVAVFAMKVKYRKDLE